jgi:TldD protein
MDLAAPAAIRTASVAADATTSYRETRHHELRKSRMLMVDGNLVSNMRTMEAGASARVYESGYWGFAATPYTDAAHTERAVDQARLNARAMGRFGAKAALQLPADPYRGEHVFRGTAPLAPKECVERLAELHDWCMKRYQGLTSTRFVVGDEHHTKRVATSTGSEVLSSIQRALCYVMLVTEDDRGAPIELMHSLSTKGHLGDLDWSLATLAPVIDELHRHLQAKRQAVPARGGMHTVVLAPELAGMLAHEAMGHPCEADLVLGGAITGDLVGQRVASDLVSMVDFAHTCNGVRDADPRCTPTTRARPRATRC